MTPAQAVNEGGDGEVEGLLLFLSGGRGRCCGGGGGGGCEDGDDELGGDGGDACIPSLPPACSSLLLTFSPPELLEIGSIMLAIR